MDRFTNRTAIGIPFLKSRGRINKDYIQMGAEEQAALYRFAEYEDLKFTPEQIKYIIKHHLKMNCETCIGCEAEPDIPIEECKEWVLTTRS